ncbi:MAG: DinB family protein [Armatimonadetes bacterium]|nr:DinB family protein [Armatimonadota bacterium]
MEEVTTDLQEFNHLPEPYGLLAGILLDGTREWRGELDSDLPPEAISWQPDPGGHSIGSIILHIADVESFWFERVLMGLPSDPNQDKLLLSEETKVEIGEWPTVAPRPINAYLAMHDQIRERTLKAIASWPSPGSLLPYKEWEFTARWIVGHVIQHESYHGGQAILLQEMWRKLVQPGI